MSWKSRLLLSLLRLGIGTKKISDREYNKLFNLSLRQWQEIMLLAEEQGVLVIAFDGLEELLKSKKGNVKAAESNYEDWQNWILDMYGIFAQLQQQNLLQKKVIADLSDIWDNENIKMMVFKGQANATFYPLSNHRSVGDIDCWLFGDAEKGDGVIKKYGAEVDCSWYRHSKIFYQDETIENHRVMSHTRGSRKHKEMEKELEAMLNPMELSSIEGCGKALMPSAQFNACFLIYHALHHFISEGLRVKQILDWAMFLQKEQNKVDWCSFSDFCKRYRLDVFAAVMNYMAINDLGVKVAVEGVRQDARYAEKIWQSTLYDNEYYCCPIKIGID